MQFLSPDRFVMARPFDGHLHLRQGPMLRTVTPFSANIFEEAVVMPNTEVPILTAEDSLPYKEQILEACPGTGFHPIMTIQITEHTTKKTIFDAKAAGVVAGKFYPKGVTSNSENGILDYNKTMGAHQAMEECGMMGLYHGEHPVTDEEILCTDRESRFLPIFRGLHRKFPRMKKVLEHCTTADAVTCVIELGPNVAGTITVHHLFLTLNDVIGGKLKPHHFCKPVAKAFHDRRALVNVVLSGHLRFFLGSDSAPWPRSKKECEDGCAGVFTAPIIIPLLAQFFGKHNQLARIENFVSNNGRRFYGLNRPQETVAVFREPWIVPSHVSAEEEEIVCFWNDRDLTEDRRIEWQVARQ